MALKIFARRNLRDRVAIVTVSGFLLAGLAGCVLRGTQPRASSDMPGTLAGNVYSSPDGKFRIGMPWLSDNATIQAERTGPGGLVVTIADDLCRDFSVSENPGSLDGQSLESWVELHLPPNVKARKIAVEMKPVTSRNGPALFVHYRIPGGFPCTRRAALRNTQVPIQLDADTGLYVYYRNGKFYRLTYVVGTGRDAPHLWYISREPVDSVLAEFADRFEISSADPR